MTVATMTALLREAGDHHHDYEKSAPKHDWADWYGAYISARQNGASPADAVYAAKQHMEEL